VSAREGEVAPDFDLPATGGERVKLSGLRGQVVVLAFYPGDFTAVCTKQLCSYRDGFAGLAATGARLLGISPDSMESHERFKKEKALPFSLLSDSDGAVSRAYGVKGLLMKTTRALLIVDRAGVIRFRKDEFLSLSFRATEEITTQVAKLKVP
jgi:peroxiredoxin Q/BCP